MSEPRFRVTINDRQRGQVQQYDVERVVQMLCLPHPDGEAWMLSFRNVHDEDIAEAIAVLLDKVYDLFGTAPLELVADKLGRVPIAEQTIDYAKDDPKES